MVPLVDIPAIHGGGCGEIQDIAPSDRRAEVHLLWPRKHLCHWWVIVRRDRGEPRKRVTHIAAV